VIVLLQEGSTMIPLPMSIEVVDALNVGASSSDHRLGFFKSTKQDRGLYKVDVVMESDRQAIMCRPDKVFFALDMFPNGVILFVCMWAQLTGKPINHEDTPC